MDSEVRRTFPKKVSKKPGKSGGKGKSLAQERRDERRKAKRQKESRMKKNQEAYESLNGPVARILEGPDDVNIQKKPTGKPDKNKNPGKKKKRQEKKAKLLNQPLAQIFEAHESSPDVDEIREIPQVNMAKKKKQFPPKVFKSDSDDDEDKEPEKMAVEEVVQVDDEPMEDEEVETEGEEDDDQEEEEDEAAEFRKKVANMPLVDVRELREKLGLKLFEKLYFAKPENKHQPINEKHQKKDRASHDMEGKKGQHRPREISSRKPVSSFRDIFKNESLGRKKWDPRFDERAGTLKEHCFDDNYQFLNEMKQQEKEVLRHELYQAVENGEEETASRITNAIRKLEEQERVKKEKDLKKAAMSEIRQENIDRMMQGQQPRFLPKAQVRRKIMEKKFEQLKTEKRLDKYLEKKAKKQSQKEKKKKGLVQHSFDAKYGYN